MEQLPREPVQWPKGEKNGSRNKKDDKVTVCNFCKGPRWWLGDIDDTSGTSIMTMSTLQGVARSHNDQVKQNQGYATDKTRTVDTASTPIRRSTN